MLTIPEARKKKKNKFNVVSSSSSLIPVLQSEHDSKLRLFKGHFKYGYIIVEKDDAKALWENGYFGDGSLSASGMKCGHKRKEKTKPSTRNSVEEVLHLCHEEALFISYAFGALVLTNEDEKEMSIDDMWLSFNEINQQFPAQYAVYHHMRCKGWVVKPGIKFGADWALYPVGPSLYHSQFLVWIQCLWEDTLEEVETLSNRRSDVTDLSAVERLSSHVSKSVLICQVLRPRDVTDDDLRSIECLKSFVIKEVVLQHWTTNTESSKSSDESPGKMTTLKSKKTS